jgi:hypothetical protein
VEQDPTTGSDRGRRTWRREVAIGLAAVVGVAVFVVAGSVAWASIPDADGVIYSCYKNSSGVLRVIDKATESCVANETQLGWNQGIRGYEVKVAGSASNSEPLKSVVIACSPGKKLLSGGGRVLPGNTLSVALSTSAPAFVDQWVAGAHEVVPTDDNWEVSGFAICAYTTP